MRIRIRRKVATSVLVLACAVALVTSSAFAATNQGTGDVNGDAAAVTASNILNLTSTQLALAKRAFLADGTALADGVSVPRGTLVKFMMYIDNTTGVPVSDMSVQDVLAATFQYQTGTIKVDNTVATGATDAAIYAAVNGQTALTDIVDGDVASITGTTIDVGNEDAANGQLNIAASKVWAVLFTVKIQ